MNFQSLRRLQSKLSVAFVAAATLVLTSCGGGGATSSPGAVGSLQLLPAVATIYAGVPYTANIVGGRKPYLVTSNEQTLLPLNFTTDSNTFSFVAQNPGVIDADLPEGSVPSRSVNVEVRDSNGTSVTSTYNVLQNFFTGYGEFYTSTCGSTGTGPSPQACSGSDSIVTLSPVSGGTRYGNREFEFLKVRGDFSFVVEDPTVTPQLVDRIRVRTDHTGNAIVRLRVTNFAPTQLATYKVTDIATGVTTEVVFLILQQAPFDAITVVPSTLTFTGNLATQCGGGSADVFIFGGTPPYTATASGGTAFFPSTVTASGGRLTITAGGGAPPCPTNANVIIMDSRGATALVTINILVGSGVSANMLVAPNSVQVLCGQSAQFTVVGGATGTYSVTSQHPRINAVISGNTGTITRASPDPIDPVTGLPTVYPSNASIVVTDGVQTGVISISTPASCP